MVGLLIELRRSPARAVLATVPLHLWFVIDFASPGVWIWDEAAAGTVGGLLMVGPVSAGIAAWAATRERRRRATHLRLLGVRHSAVAATVELTAVVLWAVVAYALVTAVVSAMTAAQATWGVLPVWWVAAGAAGLALMVTAGWCAGRLLPHPWTAPVVALGLYVCAVWSGWSRGVWSYGLAPGVVQEASVFLELNTSMFYAQLVWFTGLAGVLLLAWTVGTCRPRTAVLVAALVGSSLVAGGSAVAVAREQGQYFTGPSSFTYACGGDGPEVCVHPAYAPGLDELLAEFSGLKRKVAGTPASFSRMEQRPRGPGAPSLGAASYHIDDLGPGFAKRAVREYMGSFLQYSSDCPEIVGTLSRQGYALRSIVLAWLIDDESIVHLGGQPVEEAARSFARLSVEDRRSWFSEHYSEFVQCELAVVDFAS